MAIIECQPELDVAAAVALHAKLQPLVQGQEAVEIDGSAVRKVHAAVLQLFLVFITEAKSRSLSVQWRNPSPTLQESAKLLGIADALGL